MKSYHLNVLDKNQKKIFPNLSFLAQDGFYLAGGTALALQIGHRTSVDFDFYSNKHFDALTLYDKIEDIFGQKAKRTGQAEDTLFCKIGKADLSFFWYKHPLIKKTITFKGVPLASLGDIAAMKLIAVSRRPVKRDYIDIFFLLKRFSLEQIFSFAAEKYPNINLYFSLRALTFFDDVEGKEGKRPVKVFDKNFSWEKAKKKIFEEVKKYQLGMIKKK